MKAYILKNLFFKLFFVKFTQILFIIYPSFLKSFSKFSTFLRSFSEYSSNFFSKLQQILSKNSRFLEESQIWVINEPLLSTQLLLTSKNRNIINFLQTHNRQADNKTHIFFSTAIYHNLFTCCIMTQSH